MTLLLPFLVLLIGIALLFRVDLFFTIVWFLVGAYVLSRVWVRRTARHIRVDRTFTDRAFMGDAVSVDLYVHNTGRLPLPWLELGESIPLDLKGTPFPSQVISLGPHGGRHFTYVLQCRRRGYHQLGPLRAQTGDILGIEQLIVTSEEPRRIIVYPRVVPLDRLGLPTRSALVTLASRVPLFEDATRIMGVRDYGPGDSPRRIHWTASAHAGRLLVKRFQPAIARETLICLDLDLRDYATRNRYDATEQAIVVAASLAHHMIVRESLPVGLATEARDSLDDARREISIAPRSEHAHLMHILETLARVQVSAGEGFADLLRREGTTLTWGATIVVITGSVDDELAETLFHLKRSGHATALILVRPSHLGLEPAPPGIPVHRVWQDIDMTALA